MTKEADILAPSWLAIRLNQISVKMVYRVRDGAETLEGRVRVHGQTARIGDTILYDDGKLSVERR